MKIGIVYDFDLTLTEDFQQYPIFREHLSALAEAYGLEKIEDYWKLCNDGEMGVGWMQQMLYDAEEGHFPGLDNERMKSHFAPLIKLSPGIPDWFTRINQFADGQAVDLEHHVISVGVRPLIEGTSVYSHLASLQTGEYNDHDSGICIGSIKRILEPFRKVESLKEICKGTGNHLHDHLTLDEYHLDYRNVVVVGDGQSDKDMFRFIKQRGGVAIVVYENGDEQAQESLKEKMAGSVSVIAPRDYRAESSLDSEIRRTIKLLANNSCDMDYDIVHKLLLGQLRNNQIIRVAEKHLDDCGWCQERSELKVLDEQ
jgi:hypothetical protein